MPDNFLTSVNGLLLLSSVTIIYITNLDKIQGEFLKNIKDNYRDNLQTRISIFLHSNKAPELNSIINEFQESAGVYIIEDTCFHKKVGYKFINFFPKKISSIIKPVTHFDALMGFLGIIILICALSHLGICSSPLFNNNTVYNITHNYALIVISIPLIAVILLVSTYTISAHFQRCNFDAFRNSSEKISLLLDGYD